jgi:hypothetical protein
MQPAHNVCPSRRNAIIGFLLQIKQKASFIDREIQFLAISITDKVLSRLPQKSSKDQ